MQNVSPQASELNSVLAQNNSALTELLSRRGKSIYFPAKGILKQSAEAKGCSLNATIGVAFNNDGKLFILEDVQNLVDLPRQDIVKYSPSYGKQELRKLWKSAMKEKNPTLVDSISLPVVTSGLTHALSAAAYLFINPGDKVISPDKFWGNYRLVFELSNGAILDLFEMFNNEEINIEGLRKKLLSEGDKKVIILNFPNNPTGYSPTGSDADKLIQVMQEGIEEGKKIVVILDDAYFGLRYEDDVYEESLFARLANLDSNLIAVKVDGSTKEDFAWGLRVGYITIGYKGMNNEAAEALESKAAGFVRSSISSPSNLSQSVLIKAMSSPNYRQQKADVYETLKKRYVRVRDILDNTPKYKEYFEPLPFNSGYFMCIRLKNSSGEEVRNLLRKEFDTGVIAIGDLLRIAYSSIALSDIEKLFMNIYKAAKKLS